MERLRIIATSAASGSDNVFKNFIFLEASKSLLNGENIFQKTYFDGYHYFYSVLFALIIYPFTFIPVHVTVFLWLGFNVWLLFRLYRIDSTLLPLQTLSQKQKNIFWILTFVFSSRLIFENLHVAQMTILLLYLCLEGIHSIQHKRSRPGGIPGRQFPEHFNAGKPGCYNQDQV